MLSVLSTVDQFRVHINQLCDMKPKKSKTSVCELIFTPETNPLRFLMSFESADENVNDEALKFNLLEFVPESEEASFRDVYLTADWKTMRKAFLETFATKYNQLKLERLRKPFASDDFRSLHDYFIYMFEQYSKFSEIQKTEQVVSMILLNLPVEINVFFMVKEKLFLRKENVLDFCKLIDREAADLHTAEVTGARLDDVNSDQESEALVASEFGSSQCSSTGVGEVPQAQPSTSSRHRLAIPKIRVHPPKRGQKRTSETSETDTDCSKQKKKKSARPADDDSDKITEHESDTIGSNAESQASSSVFRYDLRKRSSRTK